jgi:large repetitive protein
LGDKLSGSNSRGKYLTAWLTALILLFGFFSSPIFAGPLAGTQITNEAFAVYDKGIETGRTASSNKVSITVGQVVSFILNPDSTRAVAPGSTLNLPYTLTNTGNAADQFNLAVTDLPGGFNFSNVQVYPDANGDGLPDASSSPIATTGSLAPGASFNFVVVVTVPPTAATGSSDQIRVDATSSTDLTKTTKGATPIAAPSIYTVNVVGGALLKLQKQNSIASAKPGDAISYTLALRNDGIAPALGTQSIILDNGPAFSPVLVRDAIPPNTTLIDITLPLPAGVTPLYHKFSDPLHTYSSTPPADLTLVDAVGFATPTLLANASINFVFNVRVNANASVNGLGEIRNTAHVLFNNGTAAVDLISNGTVTTIPKTVTAISNYADPAYSLPVNVVGIGKPFYLKADAAACNQSSTIIETRTVIITGPNGESETVTATETGPNTGVFAIPALPTKLAKAPTDVIKNSGIVEAKNGDSIKVEIQGCDVKITNTLILVDPAGVVFDSKTDAPVAGAQVTIFNADAAGVCLTTPPAVQMLDNGVLKPAPSVQTTGADGRYEYPLVPPGNYCLKVTPPNAYTFPSLVPKNNLQPGRQINAPDPSKAAGGSYGNGFLVGPTTGPIVIDIPLDSTNASGLFVQKTASRSAVEVTEFVDYSVRIKNSSPLVLAAPIKLVDNLPAGFAYVLGSARLDGIAVANPQGGVGPRLEFALPGLEVAQEKLLTYRVSVGPGALQGDGINRAQAFHLQSNSQSATAKVTVLPGVFSDKGYIIGKVYVDCNRNRVQDDSELGIPGVRLYLEDGTHTVTDSEGKFSFYGINNRTHVLKLDNTTMPAGSELINLSNRNAGDAGSRFVDLKAGELHKANFAEGSCTPEIIEQVKARRDKAEVLVAETDRRLKDKLDPDSVIRPLSDVKAQPASGMLGAGPLPPESFRPLLPAGSAARTEANLTKPVASVPAALEMEKTLAVLDNSLAFIGLNNGDTLPISQTNVRVKGTEGSTFKLSVNGREVSNTRVGKKSVLADKQLQAWEYIGVGLTPGENKITVEQIDSFGNPRGSQSVMLIAPDKLGKLVVVAQAGAAADGVSPAKIVVKLTDANGVPVTVRTPLTLEASLGRWQVDDLDKVEPGVQVFIEGGQAEFLLLAPQNPGESIVKISSGVLLTETRVDFLPDLRPLIGAGVIEGILNLRKLNTSALVPARSQDNFEQEIRQFAKTSGDGKRDVGARAAFFLKGKIKGEYLLTLGYDSDKDIKERLFRDIQPDEFYPVYGDSSLRGFDAQSTGKFYVRIDKNKSYLLYGDYTTQSNTDARRIGNYSRSLTGIKEHFEDKNVAVNAFVSRDSTRQAIEEFRANGTSGPFTINSRALENSEKIEVITRDRNQPAIVIKSELKQRFVDYSIEPLSGSILFRAPIASLDANLNPISVRVTYELDADNGEKFWIGGVDAQFKITGNIEVGAVYVEDRKPRLDPTKTDNAVDTGKATLAGVNATVKLAEKTFINGELAQSENELKGKGRAARVELKHEGSDLQASLYAGRSGTSFDNPGASLSNGRGEAGAKLAYSIDDKTRVRAEALRTEERLTGGKREGVQASLEKTFDNNIRAEIGLRHSEETSAPAQTSSEGTTPNKVDSARIKLGGPVPYVPEANVYAEYEQDIKDNGRKVAALGGDYQFASRGRLYARHEFISSLSGPYALNSNQQQNTTVFGVDSDYMQDAHLFSEYRIRDAISGGDAEAALGLRNLWHVADGVALNTNFERVYALSGKGDSASTAGGIGIEYTADPGWKASGRLELRDATTNQSGLLTLGVASKINRNWTFLEKNTLSIMRNKTSAQLAEGERWLNRLQAGLAYRDTDTDVWNALGRLEHRLEDDTTTPGIAKKLSTEIVSLNANYQPTKPFLVSGRLASKWTTDKSSGLVSKSRAHLLGTRMTYDLNNRWDIGFTASTLFSRSFNNRVYGVGIEAGYLISGNLWASAGYNFFGYHDDELAGADYTNRGAYLRLRYKFDEDLFQGSNAAVNNTLTPSAEGK